MDEKPPFSQPPYLVPALDRWKVSVLAVLFTLLLLGAMAWPG